MNEIRGYLKGFGIHMQLFCILRGPIFLPESVSLACLLWRESTGNWGCMDVDASVCLCILKVHCLFFFFFSVCAVYAMAFLCQNQGQLVKSVTKEELSFTPMVSFAEYHQ